MTLLALPKEKAAVAMAVALACSGAHCARKASPPAGPGGPAADDEVVRLCVTRDMPAFLEALAGPVGQGCATSARGVAVEMFRAGAHIGVVRGTAVMHAVGIRAAADEFRVDAAAKIIEHTRADEEKVTKTADEDMAKAVARLAAGTCIDAATAHDFMDKAAHCASSAFNTEQYEEEYARGFGAVCEHILSAPECAERAESDYKRIRREAPDGGVAGARAPDGRVAGAGAPDGGVTGAGAPDGGVAD
jgi:hypothetical protein